MTRRHNYATTDGRITSQWSTKYNSEYTNQYNITKEKIEDNLAARRKNPNTVELRLFLRQEHEEYLKQFDQ